MRASSARRCCSCSAWLCESARPACSSWVRRCSCWARACSSFCRSRTAPRSPASSASRSCSCAASWPRCVSACALRRSTASRSSLFCSCSSARCAASCSRAAEEAPSCSPRDRSEACEAARSSSWICLRRASESLAALPSRTACSASNVSLAARTPAASRSRSRAATCSCSGCWARSAASRSCSLRCSPRAFLSRCSRSSSLRNCSSFTWHWSRAVCASCERSLLSRPARSTCASLAAYSCSCLSRPAITWSMPSASWRVLAYSARSLRAVSAAASASWPLRCSWADSSLPRSSAARTLRIAATEASSARAACCWLCLRSSWQASSASAMRWRQEASCSARASASASARPSCSPAEMARAAACSRSRSACCSSARRDCSSAAARDTLAVRSALSRSREPRRRCWRSNSLLRSAFCSTRSALASMRMEIRSFKSFTSSLLIGPEGFIPRCCGALENGVALKPSTWFSRSSSFS
mmetsp:Transcript_22574/g.30916  ORF Transcript_22574/g.30916 Transcript_22574/m.30916 type:complete len:472 (-) Transcript_22574:1999-3414(-)